MGILAGRDEGAVGEHDVGGEQVVDRQPEPAGQVADAAAESQPGHSGRGQESGWGGHAERHGGVVDVTPGASGVGADGAAVRADRGAAQHRQVDDQGVVPDTQAGRVVAAAPDGDRDGAGAGKSHAGDDVRGVADAGDGLRMLIDHGVVDGAGLVVARVIRPDQVAADGGGQLFVAGFGG
jgi:hypothetical protein